MSRKAKIFEAKPDPFWRVRVTKGIKVWSLIIVLRLIWCVNMGL